MNILNKVTLQGMKKSRTRTIVTVIGVILSAAMITAVVTFGVSLLNYMAKGAAQKYGDWHVEFLDVPSSFVQERTHDKGVANTATFENIGYATLNNGKTPNKPYLFIAGFSKQAFDTLPVNLISGRLPENNNEILVPMSVEVHGGVKFEVDDKLSLAVGTRMNGNESLGQHDSYISGKETLVPKAERTYTVVGIYQKANFEESSAPGYTLITKSDAQDKADSFNIFVKLTNPRSVHAYASRTAGIKAYIFNDDVLRFMGLSDNNVINMILYAIGGIVIAIIMIGSIFLIYNSFNISLNERTHQFGILSSIGATTKQLRNSVVFEGICIGAIGIPIGVIVGIGSIGLVISVVAKNFGNILYSNVPLTLTVSIPAIVGAAAISMVTILISAYIPARKAANTPVMESIRQSNDVKVESKAVKTSKLAYSIYGLEGTLALKNFKRNKKRYLSIVLSLVLSVVLFISASAFITDMKQASERAVVFTTYDIGFVGKDMDDREMLPLYDKLKTADGVYESSYQAIIKYSCTAKASDLSDYYWEDAGSHSPDETVNLPMEIQFLDDSTYLNIIKNLGLSSEEYTGQNAKMIAVAKVTSGMKDNRVHEVDEFTDMFKSYSMNFTITPEANGKPKTEQGRNVSIKFVNTVPPDTLPVIGNPKSKNPFIFRVIGPYSLKEKFETQDTHVANKGLTFRSKNPTHSAAEMKTMIESAGITAKYNLINFSETLDQNRNMIFIANVFDYTFVIMISLISIANVFNTISTNIKLRRRELAMLRSVGMSERDFQKMMNFECAFYGMRALLFGLPIAAISSWLIYKGMFVGGADNIDFVFPWVSMVISVFSVLFIVFITMLYATRKIKKENIIDALRDDMT
ncbi:ABC transporter permease [Clostridium saccharobutylicum]|uniref:ABC transporter ATP-binding protein n=1 Tax=Clostridium saccharobutylicum DSM 13864 TaxID=1345695 RepID=U5MTU4_CLOSA|nr:FtsX-like permease family protein [Clostridium saccharobutylicum]AGX43081.1 ABC transporter ATP-binding protein [Clostridium saccharobutylicum DSM 13864]AQR90376.1 ABC transporter permease YtrF precursor [Clostridium saccharobutylicum]AQS00282.1 ABC transporter permease YtrF precursor [Clostridium saccharobutylicum]AQS14265.1 ABC transporter permease YtrF precursor [Clostridium saccharobutylicum]MBA2907054.1 putative ABC transport system permease protein [Clostridium saccharobutylicum]